MEDRAVKHSFESGQTKYHLSHHVIYFQNKYWNIVESGVEHHNPNPIKIIAFHVNQIG